MTAASACSVMGAIPAQSHRTSKSSSTKSLNDPVSASRNLRTRLPSRSHITLDQRAAWDMASNDRRGVVRRPGRRSNIQAPFAWLRLSTTTPRPSQRSTARTSSEATPSDIAATPKGVTAAESPARSAKIAPAGRTGRTLATEVAESSGEGRIGRRFARAEDIREHESRRMEKMGRCGTAHRNAALHHYAMGDWVDLKHSCCRGLHRPRGPVRQCRPRRRLLYVSAGFNSAFCTSAPASTPSPTRQRRPRPRPRRVAGGGFGLTWPFLFRTVPD